MHHYILLRRDSALLSCSVGYGRCPSRVLHTPAISMLGPSGLSLDERRFNTRMAKLRISAEWMFKDIATLFPLLCFHRQLKVRQQPVGLFYLVATDLTNIHTILRGGCETSRYFACEPPTLLEYTAPREYVRLPVPLVTPEEQAEAVAEVLLKGHVATDAEPVLLDEEVIDTGTLAFANTASDDPVASPFNGFVGQSGKIDIVQMQTYFYNWEDTPATGPASADV